MDATVPPMWYYFFSEFFLLSVFGVANPECTFDQKQAFVIAFDREKKFNKNNLPAKECSPRNCQKKLAENETKII